MRAETSKHLDAEPAQAFEPVPAPEDSISWEGTYAEMLFTRLGGAPWWAISVALHMLLVTLVGLITMTVGSAEDELCAIVCVTDLERAPRVQAEERKEPVRNALASNNDTPPTDATSLESSNIIVPPDILAEAELGDHFETVNPDRPDTHSAFGNPDAQFFHNVSGNDEPAGGGGMHGESLFDDLIGVGGKGSPGTGGGWGGGAGIGAGTGAGHGSFGQRSGGGRKLMVMRHGGGKATESAVEKALGWLAKHQEANGRWDCGKFAGKANDLAVTGMALLAFLGAGHTEKVGLYKDHVKRAVEWIKTTQQENGYLHQRGLSNGYAHAIASLALAEAAGMSRVPETVKAAQKAVDYSCELHQQGEGSNRLGWRYGPKEPGDLSVSGWFVMSIKSAKVAGLKVSTQSIDGALSFLDKCEEGAQANDHYGGHRYGYLGPGHGVRTTAIGCLCRQFLGWKKEELQGGVEYFVAQGGTPAWDANAGKIDLYYWYYGTLCVFQQGGDLWKRWNEDLKKALIEHQRKAGDEDGSWDPIGFFSDEWGRVGQTAMGCLCLEVYYRYLPLYR